MRVTVFCVLVALAGCSDGATPDAATGGGAGQTATGGVGGRAAATGGVTGTGGIAGSMATPDAGPDAALSCSNITAQSITQVASGSEVRVSSATCQNVPQGTVIITGGAVTYNGTTWTLTNFISSPLNAVQCNVEMMYQSDIPIGTCGTENISIFLTLPPQ